MYVCARCFVQCFGAHCVIKVLILCGPDKGALYAYAYTLYTQYMYNRALHTHIKLCTYVHWQWKPLLPLCSWSGYGPGTKGRAT